MMAMAWPTRNGVFFFFLELGLVIWHGLQRWFYGMNLAGDGAINA